MLFGVWLPIFALDTATPSPSLALVEGSQPVAELWLGPAVGGGRRVAEALHHLLTAGGYRPGDIEGIVVGVGPGGFTGLRIGIATALGLGQALSVPVTGASSLEALALGIADATLPVPGLFVPVVDARRHEVFAAVYRRGHGDGLEEVVAPQAWAPATLAERLEAVVVEGEGAWAAGDGLAAAASDLERAGVSALPAVSPAQRVRAVDLVRRVEAGAARPASPLYLRLPDAEVNRRRALAQAPAA